MTATDVRRHGIALLRGPALAGLALGATLGFLAQIVAFVPGFGLGLVFLLPRPVLVARRVPELARRLAREWSGIEIAPPYRPAPPAPVPGPDGRYRRDRQLYRTPRVPALMARLDWLLGDLATWRDLLWMLVHPVIGGALALLPAALVVGGAGYAATRVGVDWWALPLGLLAMLAGVAIAPALLRAHARWTRILLRPVAPSATAERRKRWIGERLIVLVRLAALLGLTLLGVGLAAVTLLGLIFTFVLGLGVVLPPLIERVRWLAELRRRLARDWSGVQVATPYLPRPLLPPRRSDGLYAVGRHLYRTVHWTRYNQRMRWLSRDPATWRDLLWLFGDSLVGAVVLLVPIGGVGYGIWGLALPATWTLAGVKGDGGSVISSPAAVPAGLALAALGVAVAPALLRVHGRWTRLLLAPTERSRLALRVQRLTETRADATEAQAGELRRIERDLHDGAQARLVAVGLTLGAIEHLLERDPAAARELLAEARATSAKALSELRDLVRGIHPPVLAERGLGDAVRALALDSPVPTEVTVELPGRPEPPVESAAYFAVSEVLTNVAKHADATRITVDVRHVDGRLRITVRDDGRGGADPARGSGLQGLRRRVGTFDGIVALDSPPGGPTTVTLEVPCELSSPKTSSC